MLKLNYTDLGLHMEQVTASIDVVVAQHVLVAIRLGKSMHVEQSRASFLMPADSPALNQLQNVLQRERHYFTDADVAIASVDHAFVEITMTGTWLCESMDGDVGVFLACFSAKTECLLHRLWQVTQRQTSLLS